jgi:DNA-binding CsgD family transcriptional regulator/tetratricopeptide (TPR) repeat protein
MPKPYPREFREDTTSGVHRGEPAVVHLVERYQELEHIREFLGTVRNGHGGQLVVEGPAGIGKTVLLAAGRDEAVSQGFRVLRARGGELEREFAFGVVYQLFGPVLAAASELERQFLLEGPPGIAARLLGLPGPGNDLASNDAPAPDPSFAVLHGLYWLCVNLTVNAPLALVVDDAHWADGPSLRFLAFLLPRLEELRVAVIQGIRPAEGGQNQGLLDALTMDPSGQRITVAPLSASGVAELVTVGLGAESDAEFAMACWEATGGTPFLVHTLLEALRHERVNPVAASAASVENFATGPLDRWAMLQLVRLGSDAGRLARAVAVLERAELNQVAQLSGLSFSDAASAAELLIRAGVLDEAPLGFVHPLLRRTIYRDMTRAERAEAHRRAARFLAEEHGSPAQIAEHLLATFPAGDEWTVEQLQSAAREAARRGAPESAVAYLRRALSEPPSHNARASLFLELGLAEFSTGQPGWNEQLAKAVESARDDTTRVAAALLFANALRWHEQPAEAVEVCDGVAVGLDESDVERRLKLEAMAVACGMSHTATAPLVSDRANVLLMRARDELVPHQCLETAAYLAAWTNEPSNQVAELALRAITTGRRRAPKPDDPTWLPGDALRHPNAVVALFCAERYDVVQDMLDMAVAEAQASSNWLVLPAVLAQRAWLAFRRGDLTAAEADARMVLDGPGPSASPLMRHRATSVLVNVLVERGDLVAAERTIQSLAISLDSTHVTAIFLHSRGNLMFAQHRFNEALGAFREAGEIATRTRALSPCFLSWRSDAALAALALGDRDAAQRWSDEELDLARTFGAPRVLGISLRTAGIVASGQRGEDLLREAIDVLAGPDTRLELARTQVALGAQLRRHNRRVDARHLLRQGIDTAHHLGAVALAERAETELRATGAKPRRVLLTGLEALTASERRIAELAADGLTNREIAQSLFITDRTVEGHLTHVFYKLDVKSRTALRAALIAPTQLNRS